MQCKTMVRAEYKFISQFVWIPTFQRCKKKPRSIMILDVTSLRKL